MKIYDVHAGHDGNEISRCLFADSLDAAKIAQPGDEVLVAPEFTVNT